MACGKEDSGRKDNSSEPSKSSRLVTVGYVQSGTGSAWSLANVESIKQNCTEENGINLIYECAEDDFDTQLSIVHSFIEQKVDLISFRRLGRCLKGSKGSRHPCYYYGPYGRNW